MCCTFSAWALPSQDKTVTLKLHNVSIETVLDAVKKQTGVNMLYNSQMFKGVPPVSIDAKNEKWEIALKLILNPQGFDYVVKDGIVVIRKMQAEKRENRIRGMVVDSNREPIPGASIIVKGTRTGTSTNIEGEFTLDVKNDKVTLEVSFIGMKKQTLQVDATRKFMILSRESMVVGSGWFRYRSLAIRAAPKAPMMPAISGRMASQSAIFSKLLKTASL